MKVYLVLGPYDSLPNVPGQWDHVLKNILVKMVYKYYVLGMSDTFGGGPLSLNLE